MCSLILKTWLSCHCFHINCNDVAVSLPSGFSWCSRGILSIMLYVLVGVLKFFLILSVMLYWLVGYAIKVCFDIIAAVRFGLSDFKHSALVFSGVCYPKFWVIVSIRFSAENFLSCWRNLVWSYICNSFFSQLVTWGFVEQSYIFFEYIMSHLFVIVG
jgi:hypothetical protein